MVARTLCPNSCWGNDVQVDDPQEHGVPGYSHWTSLWNLFFEDARHAINECFYKEVVFADDLNAYRIYPSATHNSAIKKSLNNVQSEFHKWGDANQVAFDAAKESQHVLSTSDPEGSTVPYLIRGRPQNRISTLGQSQFSSIDLEMRSHREY